MATPQAVRRYLVQALSGTPVVLKAIVGEFASDSAFWDYRPDPERFTPREVLAHLADWNTIFLERLDRMLNEDHPEMQDVDEGQVAIDSHYAAQSPATNLVRFADTRRALTAAVETIADAAWERTGSRAKIGDHTIVDFVALMVAHDCYHTRQVAESLKSWRTPLDGGCA